MAACSGQASAPQPPAGYAFPALTGRVVDQAKLLDVDETTRLDGKSAALEKTTGHQLVVVTVTSLGKRDIADYGLALGNYWGIGRKGYNDGVLLIVAPHERRVRIEVGRGLEKALTDAEAATILRDDVLPAFSHGNVGEGIEVGVNEIIGQIGAPASKAA